MLTILTIGSATAWWLYNALEYFNETKLHTIEKQPWVNFTRTCSSVKSNISTGCFQQQHYKPGPTVVFLAVQAVSFVHRCSLLKYWV